MDFRLNEEQQMYVDTVRRFVKNEILPNILQIDKSHQFPLGIISKAWELGILNLSIPKAIKGFEMDAVSTALIIKELSYGDTGISTSAMCNDLANTVIAQHGNARQQEEYLGPYVKAPLLASFCLTEPGAGSDNSSMTTFIAKRADGKYVLNGAKCFITNASYATQFTVFCKVGKPTAQLLACCIVPAEEMFRDGKPTVPADPQRNLRQRRRQDRHRQARGEARAAALQHGHRHLRGCYRRREPDHRRPTPRLQVPHRRPRLRPAHGGRDRRRPRPARPRSHPPVHAGAQAVRTADLRHARRPGDARGHVEKGGTGGDGPHEGGREGPGARRDRGVYASLAKNIAAEAALFCADEGLHLHGGYGFMSEYEISKLVRDAHIIDIYEGVREVQNMIIGRELV